MENMAEEEEEVAPAQVPTSAPDSARVPAPAPDSAPTPAPAPALAPAPAPALSPSPASAPDEAESSKCRRPRSFCCRRSEKVRLAGEALLHWGGFHGKGRGRALGKEEGPALRGKRAPNGEGMSTSLEDIAMKVLWGPGVLQNELEGFFVKGGLFLVQK